MPMHTLIREKRKEIGLTQEQVAEYLGVSTPAVNKWEKGATYPDIALLPPLARLLRTDLNTLLGFNEGISEQEIGHICNDVVNTIRKNGYESGFAMGVGKVREYPNCAALIHSIALVLEGAMLMYGTDIEDKKPWEDQITALYQRAANSDDERVRNKATYMLASKYIGRGEYDKAQEMLDMLPEYSALDKRQLQANLWIEQGKLTEAAELLERKMLLAGIHEIQTTLLSLADIALKQGNDQDAADLAELSRNAAALFGQWDYYSCLAPLQVAVAQGNVNDSIFFLRSILSAALTSWKASQSPLYRHISVPENQADFGKKILPALLSEIENGPQYAFLKGNTEFHRMIEEYRAKC